MEISPSSSSPATTTFKPYFPTRVSPLPPPPPPIPPPSIPTPPPPPEPITHGEIQQPICDIPAPITAAPWLSTKGTIIIAATIIIAITVEIVIKFFVLRKKKKQYEKYIDEKMEALELEEDSVYWKIMKRKLGL